MFVRVLQGSLGLKNKFDIKLFFTNQWFFSSNSFILQVFLSTSQSKKETQLSELLLPSINKVSKNTFGYLDLRTSLFQFSCLLLDLLNFLLSSLFFLALFGLSSSSLFAAPFFNPLPYCSLPHFYCLFASLFTFFAALFFTFVAANYPFCWLPYFVVVFNLFPHFFAAFYTAVFIS